MQQIALFLLCLIWTRHRSATGNRIMIKSVKILMFPWVRKSTFFAWYSVLGLWQMTNKHATNLIRTSGRGYVPRLWQWTLERVSDDGNPSPQGEKNNKKPKNPSHLLWWRQLKKNQDERKLCQIIDYNLEDLARIYSLIKLVRSRPHTRFGSCSDDTLL